MKLVDRCHVCGRWKVKDEWERKCENCPTPKVVKFIKTFYERETKCSLTLTK